ncbi:hypothetical protein CL628_03595 [bacterium]|nr:hypothetical protein [bacterium]
MFIGSLCEANLKAVDFILTDLAAAMPDFTFIIAGGIAGGVTGGEARVDHPISQTIQLAEDLGNKQMLGFGWYPLETWPNRQEVRWTRPEFGWLHRGELTGFSVSLLSFKPVRVDILVNGDIVKTVSVSSQRREIEIALPRISNPTITLKTNKTWKYRGDPREFGVNVSNLTGTSGANHLTDNLLSRLTSRGVRQNKNVLFISNLSNRQKTLLLQTANFALNPISLGSGSNVKMFEYLASGLPTITTSFGARGLDLTDGHQALIRDFPRFNEALRTLAGDVDLQKSLARHGRAHVVERYDWKSASAALVGLMQAVANRN